MGAMSHSSVDNKTPRLAPVLLQHAYVMNRHSAVYSLAHVVNGQQRNLYRGERFHLNASRTHGLYGCSATYATSAQFMYA